MYIFISNLELKTLFEGVNEFPDDQKLQQIASWTEEKAGSRKLDINIALRA